jgi:DNA-binding MarR family transcriptional regulator
MVKRLNPAASSVAAPTPRVGEGKRGTSGHLAYLLRQASAAVRLKLERSFAEFDMTLPQFSALTMIAAYQPLSGADLARLTLLTPQTINVITRNLVKRGAITRQPDATHGRIIRLQMTDVGRHLLRSCKSRSDRIEASLTTSLSPADERVVRAWLIQVAKDLNEQAWWLRTPPRLFLSDRPRRIRTRRRSKRRAWPCRSRAQTR